MRSRVNLTSVRKLAPNPPARIRTSQMRHWLFLGRWEYIVFEHDLTRLEPGKKILHRDCDRRVLFIFREPSVEFGLLLLGKFEPSTSRSMLSYRSSASFRLSSAGSLRACSNKVLISSIVSPKAQLLRLQHPAVRIENGRTRAVRTKGCNTVPHRNTLSLSVDLDVDRHWEGQIVWSLPPQRQYL